MTTAKPLQPQRIQQPFTEVVTVNQTFAIKSHAYFIRNAGTDIAYIDGMPLPPGDVLNEGADEGKIMFYSMQIRFKKEAGKTQEVWIRQVFDTGAIYENENT